MMRIAAGLLAMALLSAAPAWAESLIVSLSTDRVAITSNYTGASVVVFGVVERDAQTVARVGNYDIVVTVRGPRQSLVVREKQPFGPVWINRAQQTFANVPVYLGVFASRRLKEITSDTLRQRYRLGLDAIVAAPDVAGVKGGQDSPFREALIRLRTQDDLFVEDEQAVAFLTPNLFRASIPLPATAPPGVYDVDVALVSNSVLLARAQTRFQLVKIGFEDDIGELARHRPALYGAATAAMALLFGWFASVVFRRD